MQTGSRFSPWSSRSSRTTAISRRDCSGRCMDGNPLHSALRRLAFGGTLSSAESSDAFGVVMRGEATAAQVAALLMGLRVKGETSVEVAGAATALREAMVRLP